MFAVILIALVGAAFCGWFVFLDNKTMRWFSFPVLAVSAHGLMLVVMALHFLAMAPHWLMPVATVLLSVPLFIHGPAKWLQKMGSPDKK